MSKKKTIYVYAEEYDGTTSEWLTYERTGARKAKPSELTPERIAEFLDQDAENRNAHDFCGVHAKLLPIVSAFTPACNRAAFWQELAGRGGLQGLSQE